MTHSGYESTVTWLMLGARPDFSLSPDPNEPEGNSGGITERVRK